MPPVSPGPVTVQSRTGHAFGQLGAMVFLVGCWGWRFALRKEPDRGLFLLAAVVTHRERVACVRRAVGRRCFCRRGGRAGGPLLPSTDTLKTIERAMYSV